MTYFDEASKERYIPYVIEPSAGADRSTLAFLVDAYDEEEDRVVLRFHPKLAPIKVAVFPLMRKEGHPEKAREIEKMLRPHFKVQYDEAGNIGRRYRRQDEIGTPYCLTVDHDTFQDDSVTLRDRDSMEQVRIPISGLVEALNERLDA
jgi:glycyl-tRNA synthetase